MKSCLLVDDTRSMRVALRQILTPLGFICDEATDGCEALIASRAKSYDLIMLDWNMPRMTGIEYLRALRQLPEGNHPVVIMCTTFSGLVHREAARAAGANGYVTKPFSASSITDALRQVGFLEDGE